MLWSKKSNHHLVCCKSQVLQLVICLRQAKSRTIQILVLFKTRVELYKYQFCSNQEQNYTSIICVQSKLKNKLVMVMVNNSETNIFMQEVVVVKLNVQLKLVQSFFKALRYSRQLTETCSQLVFMPSGEIGQESPKWFGM